MNFFTNPAFQAVRTALIVVAVAGAGAFVFKYSHFNPLRNTATVIDYGYALPAVTTNPATSVSATGATLNGTLTTLNAVYVNVGFEYGPTTSYGTSIGTGTQYTPGSYNSGSYTSTGTGVPTVLSCGTTYHFRARASNSIGVAYGTDMTFTTSPCPPLAVATTPAVVTITSSSAGATLNGNLISTGGATSTALSFQFGTTTAYGTTVPSSPLSAPGTFGASVGISCGTTYHYRARATNSTGSANGADMTFTTSPCTPPTVTTGAATAVGQTTAMLNGAISFTSASSASPSFQYGLTTAYGASAPATLSGATVFSSSLTGLGCATTYHYRARASASTGMVYGADMTFKTASCKLPTRLNGSVNVTPMTTPSLSR